MIILGEKLKEYRYDARYTQKQVAALLKVSPSTYWNWESGRREMPLPYIYNIFAIYGITPNEFFEIY